MALLPDPTEHLTDAARAAYDHMAQARAHAEGRPELGQVYALMFNDPDVATRVGDLGGHLRFGGVLPDDVRELCILRLAVHHRIGYEWAHHQRPAEQAGLDRATIDAITAGRTPEDLSADRDVALRAVDAVVAGRELPTAVYQGLVDTWGTRGAVEIVALCGLYGLIGSMVTAFGIELEDGFPIPPTPPF